jgi:hypothetical protein
MRINFDFMQGRHVRHARQKERESDEFLKVDLYD